MNNYLKYQNPYNNLYQNHNQHQNHQIQYNNLYENPYNNTVILVPYNFNQCGLVTSTNPNPNIINNSIRGGYFSSTCTPNSNQTCYCKDTCNGNTHFNNGWWNCSNPQNGGQGVQKYFY